MVKVIIKGVEYEVPEAVAARFDAADDSKEELAKLEKGLADAKAEMEKEKARADSLQEKADAESSEDKKREDAETFRKAVDARVKLVTAASALVDDETKERLDSISDADIKKAVVLAASPKADLDGKDDVYVSARFDMVMEDEATREDTASAANKASKSGGKPDDDKDRLDASSARERMIEATASAYLAPSDKD